jgi:SAM-dependent methyltransferase
MAYEAILPRGGDTGQPLTLQKRLSFFPHYNITLANQRVIDCGCGTGQYVLEFLKQGADAYGVEFDQRKVAKCYGENPQIAQRVIVGDIEAMNFPDDSFDVALLNEVLEHVPHEKNALREVFRLLKPGGHLLIFSPNRLFPFETHGVHWKRTQKGLPVYIPFIPYIPLRLGERIFDYWARNYWPRELRTLAQSVGFQIIHTDFLWQTFENISGQQPLPVRIFRDPLRLLTAKLEKTPLLRMFGTTQAILARKPH